jgi:type II secretory pathway component GspD/PulD (secretin)
MKTTKLLPALLFASSLCLAQDPVPPPATEPAATVPNPVPAVPDNSLPTPTTPLPLTPPPAPEPLTPIPPIAPTDNPAAVPGGTPAGQMEASDEGYLLKQAALNDVFQTLAKTAGRQYFHNAKIATSEFQVTGHLNDGNPLEQMEELAFMYGLTLHTKGGTIYALTQVQLAQLPGVEFHYQLRYLRPTDIKEILGLIKPMLSPATGVVNFEPKTNTIIIIDSAHRIEQARLFLRGIDQAKGQIIVETKILRINSNVGEGTGINWSKSLGAGSDNTLSIARDLNSVFGLPASVASSSPGMLAAGGTNLVLSPIKIEGVLRALAEGDLARQISNPTLITEDNEQATISIIDRVPIITTTSTANTSGGNPTVTEEVRYKIGMEDKGIDVDPDKHREIGISVSVTPTLLPDGTVRMKLRPRSAQIVQEIVSITGNRYPRVTESMVETLARVPNGYSLVVGGFYGEAQNKNNTKIPLLGDIPVVNFFFKSKEAKKEQTSLVFIVTPKSYDPTSGSATSRASNWIREGTVQDQPWIDENNPGPARDAKSTLRRTAPPPAPYYPLPAENTTPSSPTKSKYPFAKARR